MPRDVLLIGMNHVSAEADAVLDAVRKNFSKGDRVAVELSKSELGGTRVVDKVLNGGKISPQDKLFADLPESLKKGLLKFQESYNSNDRAFAESVLKNEDISFSLKLIRGMDKAGIKAVPLDSYFAKFHNPKNIFMRGIISIPLREKNFANRLARDSNLKGLVVGYGHLNDLGKLLEKKGIGTRKVYIGGARPSFHTKIKSGFTWFGYKLLKRKRRK